MTSVNFCPSQLSFKSRSGCQNLSRAIPWDAVLLPPHCQCVPPSVLPFRAPPCHGPNPPGSMELGFFLVSVAADLLGVPWNSQGLTSCDLSFSMFFFSAFVTSVPLELRVLPNSQRASQVLSFLLSDKIPAAEVGHRKRCRRGRRCDSAG